MRIVIADDAAFIRIMLKDILAKGEHEVVGEAKNAYEAIQLYFEKKPDVLLMNINMGDVDGITAMMAILKKDPQANLIICSADSRPETVTKAIRAGAKGFLVKPFLPDKVYKMINRAIGDNLKFNVDIDKKL